MVLASRVLKPVRIILNELNLSQKWAALILERVCSVVEEDGLSIDNPEQIEPTRSLGSVEIGIKVLSCP